MEKRETAALDLPGFRFHPTEEELLDFYLKKAVHGRKLNFDIIGDVNIYLHDPCDLPGLAKIGEREWYFFVPRDRRSGNGGRPNRTTKRGFWKATGSDRPIRSAAEPRRLIGLRKTLVFYQGRAPRGKKTDWVMNEYRLPEESTSTSSVPPKEDIVLCKVYRKATSLKELEQRAFTMEEEIKMSHGSMSTVDNTSIIEHENSGSPAVIPLDSGDWKEMKEEHKEAEVMSMMLRPFELPELHVPNFSSEWMQDPFLTQLRSPWLDQWSPYANILNFS